MNVTVIPINADVPPVAVTPGQSLSARERGAVHFRNAVQKEFGQGPKRSADLITGYKRGWDDAVSFLRAQGTVR